MYDWLKSKSTIIITILVTGAFLFFAYSCEPKVKSLYREGETVTRQGLQLELDQLIGLAEIRMANLDRQDAIRGIILQNALILVQGQPFNPLGLITAIAGLYGIKQASSNTIKVVKELRNKRKVNNGTT